MKAREIFRLELGLQLRRVWTWLLFVAVLAMTWQMSREVYVANARIGGYWFNGPFVIAAMTLIASLVGLLACAAPAGDAGARDAASRLYPLVYTAPVSRGAYLGGRFAAALAVAAIVMLAAPIGLLVAAWLPRPEPALLGPFHPVTYLGAYLGIALPNAFIATALAFAAAASSRKAMAGWAVAVGLFAASMLCYVLLAARLGRWDIARLLDPLGLTSMAEISRSWTAHEKNLRLPWLAASFATGRVLWTGIAAGALALTYLRFRFEHLATGGSASWREAWANAMEVAPPRERVAVIPRAPRSFGAATRLRQMLAVSGESVRVIVLGWGGLGFGALAALIAITGPNLMAHLGVPMFPTTSHLTDYLGRGGDLFDLVIPLLIAFYAGELVWRERDARLAEMSDATPVPDWTLLAGRCLGMVVALVLLQGLMLVASIIVQLRMGYTALDLGLYLRIMFGLQLADRLLFALLAVALHVLVNQKYVGHAVVILLFAFMALAPGMGVEHVLLVFGEDPGWSHSDMRGFGPFLGPWLTLEAYWAAWVLLFVVAARLLWVRGREQAASARLRVARSRLTRRAATAGAVSLALILSLGGFVFYNTNVLNEYRTAEASTELRAEYERRYGRYEGVPQPSVASTTLRVVLEPSRRRAEIVGTYRMVNRHTAPIESILVATSPAVETRDTRFSRPARRVVADERLDLYVYALETPLQPGDSLRLDFTVRRAPRGFVNRAADAAVSPAATFIRHSWLPTVGYRADREIDNPGDRRAHGLPARPAVPSPRDSAARWDLAASDAERTMLDVTVSTEAPQMAVAPGRLVRTWASGGRRHFHYVTDAPIRKDFSIHSAVYAVHATQWTDPATARRVDIEVIHHPGHARNVARMAESVRASLQYLSAQLGPYPQGQLRLVEHPGHNVSLHASPVNVSYFEGFGIMDPASDPRDIDFQFGVVAHEVAHQWWGNLVMPAYAQGGPLLSESLAWYSALAVVEQRYGRAHLERMLAMLRDAYFSPRARAGEPLLTAYDEFQAYRKGVFAMYSLREHVGEARVSLALRRVVERYAAGTPPLPTSLDLYRELEAVTPDSLRPLLVDLLARNAYWELETERASAEPDGDGAWRVTLDVKARKVVVDTIGLETDVPMNDVVEIGVYGAEMDRRDAAPLYLRGHRVRSGTSRIVVTVPREPGRAVLDPRGLQIDVEPADNGAMVRVTRR